MTPIIVRSKRHGSFRLRTTHWGSYLSHCDDPMADDGFNPAEAVNDFHIPEGLHRIPANIWQPWIQLCFHYAPMTVGQSLEVGCRILVSATDPSQYRLLVPRQSVSGGSVHATNFDDSVDLISGEAITSYPPDGWIPCGSSHSHGRMGAFWSATDDGNELGDPGLHITIGSVRDSADQRTYDLCASITADRKRFKLPWDKFVDCEPVDDNFHPNVLNWVKAERPPAVRIPSFSVEHSRNYNAINTRGGNGNFDYGVSRPYRKGRRHGFDGLNDINDSAPYSWTPDSIQPYPLAARVIENALEQASIEQLLDAVKPWLDLALEQPNSMTAFNVCNQYNTLIAMRESINEIEDNFIEALIFEEETNQPQLPLTGGDVELQLTIAASNEDGDTNL